MEGDEHRGQRTVMWRYHFSSITLQKPVILWWGTGVLTHTAGRNANGRALRMGGGTIKQNSRSIDPVIQQTYFLESIPKIDWQTFKNMHAQAHH